MANSFVTPMQKGIKAAKVKAPPEGSYEGVDLSVLPQYISFKAALIKEKMIWQSFSLVLSLLFGAVFIMDRLEIRSLYQKNREKEYIVLPDFIPVSPHSISDKYVEYAVDDFIQKLGSISSDSVEKQYAMLAENMSLDFRRQFEEETLEWMEYVKEEKITEIVNCPKKEIISHDNGIYQITALCKKQTYINHDHIGQSDEVIEMKLAAIPPKKAKQWVLEIQSLSRSTKKTFKVKKKSK